MKNLSPIDLTAMGAGAGGGNRAAAGHAVAQHAIADAQSMMSKPKKSVSYVSSSVKPKGKPSNAGSPVAGKAGKRSYSHPKD